jgi:formylglycine-generating enzyme
MDILVRDPIRAAVEAATGGRVTVLYDSTGSPHYMHRFPRFKLEALGGLSLGTGWHPAFLSKGKLISELLIGQYQLCKEGDKLYTVPGHLCWPLGGGSTPELDAIDAVKSLGQGFHLITNWEWAAIALWTAVNRTQPRGCRPDATTYQHEVGLSPAFPSSFDRNILTGTGPVTWRHDGSPAGISDLVGNAFELVTGVKLDTGMICLPPDNDWTLSPADLPATSIVLSRDLKLGKVGTDVPLSTASELSAWRSLTTTTAYASLPQADQQKLKQACIDPTALAFPDPPLGQFSAVPKTSFIYRGGTLAESGIFDLFFGRANVVAAQHPTSTRIACAV